LLRKEVNSGMVDSVSSAGAICLQAETLRGGKSIADKEVTQVISLVAMFINELSAIFDKAGIHPPVKPEHLG
jgi:hypothetical protein